MGTDIKDTYGALAKFAGVLMDPDALTIVGLDVPEDFAPELADPDRLHHDKATSEGLAQSVQVHGVREPITIVKVKDRTCVVDGRQRTMAARTANKRLREAGADFLVRVPCVPDKGKAPTITMVITNEHRREETILSKARKADRLATMGHAPEEVAVAFGVTEATLRNWSRLLSLTPALQARIERGDLTVAVGYELGRLPPDAQAAALEKIVQEGGDVTGVKARENVRAKASGDTKPAESKAFTRGELRALHTALGEASTASGRTVRALLGVILGEDPKAKGIREHAPNEVTEAVLEILKGRK